MMKNFGMHRWTKAATVVSVLACCHLCRSQAPSEIVVFDASQSNPGGTQGLIWTEWLSSRYGIPTPTENGTAYWTVPIRNLDTEVTNYLAAHSPKADSLVVIGNIFPDDVEPAEYAVEMSTQVRRLAGAGVQNFVIHRVEYLTHTMIAAPFRESVAELNAVLDPVLPDLQQELGVSIVRPPLEGFVGFDDVIENAEKYGFLPETLAADAYASVGSPPNPHQFIWWDDGHPTTSAHRVLANEVFQTLGFEYAPPPFPLKGKNGQYEQGFDDLRQVSDPLPEGWVGEIDGAAYTTLTGIFSPRIPVAGALEVSPRQGISRDDRALLVGVTDVTQQNDLLFQARIVEEDLSQFRLTFDLEAWAMNPELAAEMGEAAFDVTIEADTGDGYSTVLDLGTASTGPTLLKPRNGRLDGNEDASRINFDSGFQSLELPAGSMLRVRFSAAPNPSIEHVTFGVDSFRLHTVPEPTGRLLMMLGMIAISTARRRRRGSYLMIAALRS